MRQGCLSFLAGVGVGMILLWALQTGQWRLAMALGVALGAASVLIAIWSSEPWERSRPRRRRPRGDDKED